MGIRVGQIVSNENNNRLIVIHEDGTYDVVSSLGDFSNIDCFKEYLNNYYLDDNNIRKCLSFSNEDIIIYLMVNDHSDIILLEDRLNEKRKGVLYLPNNISEDQEFVYKNLKQIYLSHFDLIVFKSDVSLNESIISSTSDEIIPPNFTKLDEKISVGKQK